QDRTLHWSRFRGNNCGSNQWPEACFGPGSAPSVLWPSPRTTIVDFPRHPADQRLALCLQAPTRRGEHGYATPLPTSGQGRGNEWQRRGRSVTWQQAATPSTRDPGGGVQIREIPNSEE